MMPNPFAKSRPQHQPYAIYRAGDFIFHVCKTYSKDPMKPYARFFVWASSPFTHGSMEGGDTYADEVLSNARLVAAEPEWLEVYGPHSIVAASVPITEKLMTPEEYIAQHATVEVI
jgi:hypothetical protein